jgi:hypothetical protein
MYATPCSIVENAAYAFSPTWQAIAINTKNNLLSNVHGNILAALVLLTVQIGAPYWSGLKHKFLGVDPGGSCGMIDDSCNTVTHPNPAPLLPGWILE